MASVKSYIEDMMYGVQDFTGSTFSEYIDAMYSEKGSAIVMADFEEIAVGDISVFEKNKRNVLFLFPQNINIEALDMGEDEITVELLCVIQLSGGGRDNLAIKALRYEECFRHMINDDKTLGAACDYAQVARVGYYGPVPGDTQTMGIEITVIVTLTVPNGGT
jgi:hypothetical protein